MVVLELISQLESLTNLGRHMNYVNIYGKSFSYEDKEFLYKIFGFINVEKGRIKFIDMDTMQPNPESLINFCIDNTHTDFSRALIASRKFSAKDLITGNAINDDMKFILYNVPLSVAEIQATESNKAFTWKTLLEFKEQLIRYGYLDVQENAKEEAPAEEAQSEVANVVQDEESKTTVTVNVEEVLNRVIDELKATDLTLGKSLKLTKRISVQGKDGQVLNIYPGNKIDESQEGAHISFKDMLAVVKLSFIVGSENINFHTE